jgi:hypothetical protein
MKLFSIICDLFLVFFQDVKISLMDQLVKLAQLSHVLLYVFVKSKKEKFHFLKKDLYMYIQSTIQDAFICAAKYRAKNSN